MQCRPEVLRKFASPSLSLSSAFQGEKKEELDEDGEQEGRGKTTKKVCQGSKDRRYVKLSRKISIHPALGPVNKQRVREAGLREREEKKIFATDAFLAFFFFSSFGARSPHLPPWEDVLDSFFPLSASTRESI